MTIALQNFNSSDTNYIQKHNANNSVLAAAIKRIGPCGLPARQHTDHLTALVRAKERPLGCA